MSMWSLRWHFTNKSVTGAPYSIKGYSYSLVTQPNTMVTSTMTETVPSWGRGGTAAAMAQNEQATEEHSTLEQQSPGRLDHLAWCVVWTVWPWLRGLSICLGMLHTPVSLTQADELINMSFSESADLYRKPRNTAMRPIKLIMAIYAFFKCVRLLWPLVWNPNVRSHKPGQWKFQHRQSSQWRQIGGGVHAGDSRGNPRQWRHASRWCHRGGVSRGEAVREVQFCSQLALPFVATILKPDFHLPINTLPHLSHVRVMSHRARQS